LATEAFEAVETVCSAPVRWLLLATSDWVNGFLQFYFKGAQKAWFSAGLRGVSLCHNSFIMGVSLAVMQAFGLESG
jgi:hypothetical protein